jgi:hypothetical protein
MVKEKRKVAEVTVRESLGGCWRFLTVISNVGCCQIYETRASALRGARRFCKVVGHEMKLVK